MNTELLKALSRINLLVVDSNISESITETKFQFKKLGINVRDETTNVPTPLLPNKPKIFQNIVPLCLNPENITDRGVDETFILMIVAPVLGHLGSNANDNHVDRYLEMEGISNYFKSISFTDGSTVCLNKQYGASTTEIFSMERWVSVVVNDTKIEKLMAEFNDHVNSAYRGKDAKFKEKLHNTASQFARSGELGLYVTYLKRCSNNIFSELEDVELAIKALRIAPMLSDNACDVLIQLAAKPTFDGDLCSKAGRNELAEYGAAIRIMNNGDYGDWAANELGYLIYKEVLLINKEKLIATDYKRPYAKMKSSRHDK